MSIHTEHLNREEISRRSIALPKSTLLRENVPFGQTDAASNRVNTDASYWPMIWTLKILRGKVITSTGTSLVKTTRSGMVLTQNEMK
jgi:hypothetical protein